MPEGGPQNNPPKQEGLNIKPFSTEFVKAQIQKLLGSVELIKTVRSVEVAINTHNQMRLDLAITAKGFDISVTAVLVNKGDSLAALEEPKVEGHFLVRGFAKEAIKPHVDNVGKLLKEYIEKTENQKVQKIEIKNGQLEVTFEKKAEAPKMESSETKETYKSTLTHRKGYGYFNSANQLIYYETPKTMIIDGYELTTNTPINVTVGAKARGENGYIAFTDTSYFDYKTGKLTLGYDDGSTEITVRKLTEQELEELKQKQQKFQDKIGKRTKDTPEKRKGFSRINLKRGDNWYTLEHNIVDSEMSALQDSFVVTFKNVAEVNLKTGEVKKLDGWKEEFEVNVSEEGGKNKTKETKTTKPAKPEAKKIVQLPKKPIEKPEPKPETLPPGVFSAEYIKDIVFDLLEEEGKTPESYEIIKDEKGIQTFVLKFTDGTTNEHSVRGVLGLRLRVPIFDLEGIEPVDGGKNFRLVWKTGIENEATEKPKSKKEIELEKLIAREAEVDAFRAALLRKLEEIERNKKK